VTRRQAKDAGMGIDLKQFTGVLPYDSQLYGIYQPLLGWRSKLQMQRLDSGLRWTRRSFLWAMAQRFKADFRIDPRGGEDPSYELRVGAPGAPSGIVDGIGSFIADLVARNVRDAGGTPDAWQKFTSREFLDDALAQIGDDVHSEFLDSAQSALSSEATHDRAAIDRRAILGAILKRESIAAGVLADLGQRYPPDDIARILGSELRAPLDINPILRRLDPARSDMAEAALSPIGVVHLFRQYFFEFATFLGSPAQHVWLSPGGSVELVEVSTRRQLVERTAEQSLETTQKTEQDTTTSDELSDAVKQENSSDTKLGVSATSATNYKAGFVNGSVTVSGSFNLDKQQKAAREQTHKATRQQTQKLSSEIRQSFKTTVRTVTETTDVSSKRYVLANTTPALVNYELRRKMRQVGVQLQDYGTRLCWQAYVDNPGDDLGLPIFVHAAPPPNLQDIKFPDAPPSVPALTRGEALVVHGSWDHGDEAMRNFIPIGQPVSIAPPAGLVLDHVEVSVQQGPAWTYRAWPANASDKTVQIHTNPVMTADDTWIRTIGDPNLETDELSVVQVLAGIDCGAGRIADSRKLDIAIQLTPIYRQTREAAKAAVDAYTSAFTEATEATKLAYQEALFQSMRERVELASGISPRSFTELREEERIVVYRKLVGDLLKVAGVETIDPNVRHVFSEVVASMFDMDSMLYFVAPDWWMPRAPVTSTQAIAGLGLSTAEEQGSFTPGAAESNSGAHVVGWGGARGIRDANYYITDRSQPAPLGSSLGWLLQLDGDNFRNAFLNAPWVKAVIPLQEGHEWKALEWLSSPEAEGSEGLNGFYLQSEAGEIDAMLAVLRAQTDWPSEDLAPRYAALKASEFTVLDAIRYLIVSIQAKQAAGQQRGPGLDYLPADKVYENGFDPLAGGFVAQPSEPFEVFDQWVEVLPTDQIVPVEVAYDPKTGQQL
jgi:hypothetical protein